MGCDTALRISDRFERLLCRLFQVLIVLQFVYSMNLTADELYPAGSESVLKQVGLTRPADLGVAPCVPFYVKTLLSLPFFVTLRLYLRSPSVPLFNYPSGRHSSLSTH